MQAERDSCGVSQLKKKLWLKKTHLDEITNTNFEILILITVLSLRATQEIIPTVPQYIGNH